MSRGHKPLKLLCSLQILSIPFKLPGITPHSESIITAILLHHQRFNYVGTAILMYSSRCRMWWVPWLVLAVVACAQDWRCPHISDVSCSCDFPHTLRCTGGPAALETIADALRALAPSASVSLLDCSLQNLSFLPGSLLQVILINVVVCTRCLNVKQRQKSILLWQNRVV